MQQIMDKIHCYYFHTFDTGYALTKNEQNKITDEIDNDNKKQEIDDTTCKDVIVKRIFKSIMKKKKHCENISGLERLKDISSRFVTEIEAKDQDFTEHYSFGFRYFYWDYYKNNTEEVDPVQLPDIGFTHSNKGYKVGDFFIHPKFNDLKEELLNNVVLSISKDHWDKLLFQAQCHVKTDHFSDKRCTIFNCLKYYNIKNGTQISSAHLVAMLAYCSITVLQRKFSETFRKIPNDESIQSLIRRHQNYAHFARLLREIVDCFGERDNGREYVMKQIFYHGMILNCPSFPGMCAPIKGPMSTSTDFSVAVNFSANMGMILKLKLTMCSEIHEKFLVKNETDNRKYSLFDCTHISPFINEQETFFIGGYSHCMIKSIIEATGNNYGWYVSSLAELWGFLCSTHSNTITLNPHRTKQRDELFQVCFRIILDQLHQHYPDNDHYVAFQMPPYVRKLVEVQFASITGINVFSPGSSGDTAYCFPLQYRLKQLFHALLCYDYGWIKLDIFGKLFPSLQYITFRDQLDNDKFIECISIYRSLISFVQNNPTTNLKHVQIWFPDKVNVIVTANRIVSQFKKEFAELNWEIFIAEPMFRRKRQKQAVFGLHMISCHANNKEQIAALAGFATLLGSLKI
eukprot:366368_1